MTELRDQILDLSRQNQIGELDSFFSERLDHYITREYFPTQAKVVEMGDHIQNYLSQYATQEGVSTVVLGMSGGVDSALTAALFKRAGWRVIGVTMPIHQEQSETDRGINACEALRIEHLPFNLTNLYDQTISEVAFDDSNKIRLGNIRARLRMITLYHLAAQHGGLVASTDNWSELVAGFWTLHGDVGDLSPIQALTKSWEVPCLARLVGVPEETYRAVPTDGLGISNGDEAQLGCSYLEWDLMSFCNSDHYSPVIAFSSRAQEVEKAWENRVGKTWFKRHNPINVPHHTQRRFGMQQDIDYPFIPKVVRNSLDRDT